MEAPIFNVMLTKKAIKDIQSEVDELFDRLKYRLLGPQSIDKRIYVNFQHELSIPGLFEAAAREEGAPPSEKTLNAILEVAGSYIDSYKAVAQARIVHEVNSFLNEAEKSGVKTDVETVLGGKLADIWKNVSNAVHSVIDSEAQNAKNFSIMDGIVKINVYNGIDDPIVGFVVVKDKFLCKECKKLHLLEDGVTPRLWKLSECKHGYHKKDEEFPAIGGEHPHCRCSMFTYMPGYSFDSQGKIIYKNKDHNEFEIQRGIEKD